MRWSAICCDHPTPTLTERILTLVRSLLLLEDKYLTTRSLSLLENMNPHNKVSVTFREHVPHNKMGSSSELRILSLFRGACPLDVTGTSPG